MVKKAFRAIGVVTAAVFETVTVSLPQNVKKRWNREQNKYLEVKVPSGYPQKKAEPEYKDLSKDNDFSGIPGLPF
jgi:hypothetical protein